MTSFENPCNHTLTHITQGPRSKSQKKVWCDTHEGLRLRECEGVGPEYVQGHITADILSCG
jgi:hypothetical protein